MLAIRNYGHFWNRDYVDWGRRGAAGRMEGYVVQDRRPFIVDFRDQIGVYILFTSTREAVYVGQAGMGDHRLFIRLKQHTRDHLRDRWQNFSWFGMREVNQRGDLSEHQKPESRCLGTNRDALSEVEAVLLQLFEPRLNKQGPRWGEGTTEFLQYVPWEWDENRVAPLTPSETFLSEKIDQTQSDLNKLLKREKI
jgi:hypothetical protein